MEEIDLQDIDRTIIHLIQEDISDAEDYQDAVIFPAVTERYEIYYADKNYYARKFPKLSKVSNLVSTDVTDTIEWALPSLMKVFTGSDSVVSVTGVLEEDARNAEVMQELMEYQLSRQNNFFPLLYNWMKDALITGLGIVKCYWDRQEKYNPVTVLINSRALEQLTQAGVEIQNVQGPDEFGDFTVTYLAPYYTKNSPKIENILISEFLYSSDAKNLEEANFVAHKKKVTMSYLRQKEKQGVYSNVDDIKVKNNVNFLNNNNIVEQAIGDQYNQFHQSSDDARDEVYIYECYTKIDINADGILEDMIITTCEDTILRVEENYMGRHPFFSISPTKDPHRIWVKRSYAELIGELQDLKVALMRQLMQNIALTNDPKMILSEDAININDYIEGRAVIRKKAGHQMGDVAMAMPVNQMHPWTFQFLEYIEGQKENRTGITRYNQGLDAQSLNKMLALDTPIPLIDGSYKLNKDIVEGDILVGSDGKSTTVLKAHPIQTPDRAFKLTFETGDVIKAGGEHRWSVKVANKHNSNKSPEWEKLPTERIFDLVNSGHKVWIPRVSNVDFIEKDLPIDPYVFGAWLGDGNSHTNRFTTMDNEVKTAFDIWSKKFYNGHIEMCKQQNAGKAITYSIVNTPFREIMKDLCVLKDGRYKEYKDNVKHIPEIFLCGSFNQRLQLLRGLMDTDGCISKTGQAVFCNSEPALISSFVKLINSFGLKASISWSNGSANKFPNARPHAHVYFSSPFCPVSIKYKVDRWKTKEPIRWEQQKLVSIEEIPVEPMRCLTVDSKDELYACGNIITLTSNTATGISAILGQSSQRLELIARMFAETGVRDLFKFMVSLNQKFVDQNTVIRLTNKELQITPDDLQGDFDLIVNSGISITTKESTLMTLQTLLTALMQASASGAAITTPGNIYNLFKKWIETAGFKNYTDFITDPVILQQKAMIDAQMVQQVLMSLPPEAFTYYTQNGTLPPEFLLRLPPQIQALFGSALPQQVLQQGTPPAVIASQQQTQQGGVGNGRQGTQAAAGTPSGNAGGGVSQDGNQSSPQVAGQLQRHDNRTPDNVPRGGNGEPQEQARGIGGF